MKRNTALVAALLAALVAGAQEAELSAELHVQSDQVFLGEQFPVQIRVWGSTRPREPDLGGVQDFEIRYLGGAPFTGEHARVTDEEGSRSVSRGYVFSYYFSATTTGTHVIPAITVWADGSSARTKPVQLSVVQSTAGGDFRLSVEASKNRVHVGEGFQIHVTWYLNTSVRGAKLVVPFLADTAFRFRRTHPETTHNGTYAKTWVNDQEVVVELGQAMLNGRPYDTVTYEVTGTPLKAGTYTIPASTVHFEALVERQRQRSLTESFFNTGAGGDYRPFVVSAGESALRVVDLPAAGRPPRFAGHVGRYTIRALAEPREVTVGDPIALTVVLSGPINVEDSPAPDLAAQRVARLFDLGSGPPQSLPSASETRTPEKVWVYTIRAQRAGTAEIPPIELPYFDPVSGRYQVARSAAFPIHVVGAHVVTSRDAEGAGAAAADGGPRPEAAVPDLTPSAMDVSILRRQDRGLANLIRRPMALGALVLSLAVLFAAAFVSLFRKLGARPRAPGAGAYRACERALRPLAAGAERPQAILSGTLNATTRYLCLRLGLEPGKAASGEVLEALGRVGAPEEPATELRDVFRICEAGRYAGYPLSQQTAAEAARRGLAACTALESNFFRPAADRAPKGAVAALAVALALAAQGPQAAALDSAATRRILKQADELLHAAEEARAADPAAARPLYLRCAELLEQLVAYGASGALYTNLGYAYHRGGVLGRAILAYRRAELLTPREAALRSNLDRARSQREDGPGREPAHAAPGFLAAAWARGEAAAVLILASAVLGSLWLLTARRAFRRAVLLPLAPALLLLVSLLTSDLAPLVNREGVITHRVVPLREGDGDLYRQVGSTVHEGAEFVLREVRSNWYRIQFPDGLTGWIPAAAAELVVADAARSTPW